MSHRFSLQLLRVQCETEQLHEVGKDEMRLFLFAVSRKGQFFSPGYRNLGSYGDGDVRSDGIFPMPFIETELPDDGLQVLLFGWLVEEDGGGVRNAQAEIEQEFRTRFLAQSQDLLGLGLPRECIPFTAFFQVALPMTAVIELASFEGRNDKVFDPFETIVDRPTHSLFLGPTSKGITFRRARSGGDYILTFRIRYEPIPEIVQ
jgi:hypothetical protein